MCFNEEITLNYVIFFQKLHASECYNLVRGRGHIIRLLVYKSFNSYKESLNNVLDS